jgi:hypothetical protein
MFNLFGKKEAKKENNPEQTMKAIEDLSKKIDEMSEKMAFNETKIKNLNNQAKEKLKSGDKNGARQLLAKKKKYDEQIKQFDGAVMLMEEQKMMLESAESMKSIFDTIKTANKQIQKTQEGMSADDMMKVKEDLEDFKYIQKEMNEIFDGYRDENTEEVEDELNQLEAEINNETNVIPEVGNLFF